MVTGCPADRGFFSCRQHENLTLHLLYRDQWLHTVSGNKGILSIIQDINTFCGILANKQFEGQAYKAVTYTD